MLKDAASSSSLLVIYVAVRNRQGLSAVEEVCFFCFAAPVVCLFSSALLVPASDQTFYPLRPNDTPRPRTPVGWRGSSFRG